MADSVSSVGCRALLAACGELGLDTRAFGRRQGVAEWRLSRARVPSGRPTPTQSCFKCSKHAPTLIEGLERLPPVVDEVRQVLLLRGPTSDLAAAAKALGTSSAIVGVADQSSFTRSFKRWTGSTPAEFRARA